MDDNDKRDRDAELEEIRKSVLSLTSGPMYVSEQAVIGKSLIYVGDRIAELTSVVRELLATGTSEDCP